MSWKANLLLLLLQASHTGFVPALQVSHGKAESTAKRVCQHSKADVYLLMS